MKLFYKIGFILLVLCTGKLTYGQSEVSKQKKEAIYYKIEDVPIPPEVSLEVGGLALTEEDKLGVSTRRGEVWLIDNPYSKKPIYKRYAHGLHEALGLGYRNNGFYLAQRGELTRLEDNDNDGVADVYKTVYAWPLSGNYHEYSYGPEFMKNGDMLVTLNLAWIGYGASLAKWRGWLLKITPEGEMSPIATGLRSPAGFTINNEGAIFYAENQGDWVGSGRITHLELGDFAGNPEGLRWTNEPASPLKLKLETIEKESGLNLYAYSKKEPALKAPAVWFPHTILGISTSDILQATDTTNFGPFKGQMFVGDQGHSTIMRVFMEKVNGVYQGASFPFKSGFSSGVLRMIWGSDSSMFVGMTSRGWRSTGKKQYGLQRLVWTGKVPFEIQEIHALADGFQIKFTKPVQKNLAKRIASYQIKTFNYLYHETYGSPIVDQEKAMVHKVEVADDNRSVKLTVHGMKLGYIHQLTMPTLKAAESGEQLLHDTGYYTLNEVPGGKLKSLAIKAPITAEKKTFQPKRVNKMPEAWNGKTTKEIVVGTLPGLKYDIKELVVKRGTKLKVTFNNNDDMLHNLVITEKGIASVDKVGDMALRLGLDGAALNYVPDTPLVISHTGIVAPETSETIYVDIPKSSGIYWIVCTFPGHSSVMRTKLIVE